MLKNLGPISALTTLLLVTLALYSGLYCAMLGEFVRGELFDNDRLARIYPTYRFGGKFSEVAFAPAHYVHRRIDPRRWADASQLDIIIDDNINAAPNAGSN